MKKLKVYISGQITNGDSLTKEQVASNLAQFDSVELILEHEGHEPVSPLKVMPYDPKHTWEDYMVADIRALFACDAILMLDNWTESRGARIEHAIAKEMGLKVFYNKNHNLF